MNAFLSVVNLFFDPVELRNAVNAKELKRGRPNGTQKSQVFFAIFHEVISLSLTTRGSNSIHLVTSSFRQPMRFWEILIHG